MAVGVNRSTLCQEYRSSVLGPLLMLLYTSELFSLLENMFISYVDDSTEVAIVPSPGVWFTVAQSHNRDVDTV